MDIEPTFKGYIDNEHDAVLILQATLDGLLKHIPRRPYEIERPYLITSGSIFVFIEEVSGIKRWTDGVSWSPSRISGKFLVYREFDKASSPSSASNKKSRTDLVEASSRIKLPPILSTPSSNSPPVSTNVSPKSTSPGASSFASTSSSPSQLTKSSSVSSNGGKYTGFIKKTMSVKFKSCDKEKPETLHMVSYYNMDDLEKHLLVRPSNSAFFQNVKPCRDLLLAMENTTLGNGNKNAVSQVSNNSNSPLFATQKPMGVTNKITGHTSNEDSYVKSNDDTAGSIPLEVGQNQQHQQQQQQQQHQQPPPLVFLKRQSAHSVYQSDDNVSTTSSSSPYSTTINTSAAQFQQIAPTPKPFFYQPNPTFQQQQASTGPVATLPPSCYANTGAHSSPHPFYQMNGSIPIDPNAKSNNSSFQLHPINGSFPYYQGSSNSLPFPNNCSSNNNGITNNNYPAPPNNYLQGLSVNPNINPNPNNHGNTDINAGKDIKTDNFNPNTNSNSNNNNSDPTKVNATGNSDTNSISHGNVLEVGLNASPQFRVNYANFSNYTSQPTSLPTIHQPTQFHQQSHGQQLGVPFYQQQMALHPPLRQPAYMQSQGGHPPSMQMSSSLMNSAPFMRNSPSNHASPAISNAVGASTNVMPVLMNIGPSVGPLENGNAIIPK